MKKEWWIIGVLALIIFVLVVIIIAPKTFIKTNPYNQTENNSNNNFVVINNSNNSCLKEGETGLYGENKCCSGLSEEVMQTGSVGSIPFIVCNKMAGNSGQKCTKDSDCSGDLKCWYQIPTSLRAGIPGTETLPGICVPSVMNIQE
ncbi:Uncharacterised protein [uncultured archaeon]|nr:Uncharacterised protein [uncultured archaeon]